MIFGQGRDIAKEYQDISLEEKPLGGNTVIKQEYGQTSGRVRVRIEIRQ